MPAGPGSGAGFSEDLAWPVDGHTLGENQHVVDDLAVHPNTRKVPDDDPSPSVSGCGGCGPLCIGQPTDESDFDRIRRGGIGKDLRSGSIRSREVNICLSHVTHSIRRTNETDFFGNEST